jgi:serine phosphatase RsbU (regulator of sigma subunit)
VVICRYTHATGEFTWAKAGHEPPIIAGRPDGDEAGASPLGFGFGDGWPQFSHALAPGERLCLFTDGLIEARKGGEQLGRAHLRSLVEQGMSAQELLAQIQSDAEECPDDLAAVVITRAPAIAPLKEPASDTRQPATV